MSMFHELMMRKKEEIMYATIKGTLTENDGVFSGFSASNYLEIPNIPTYTQDDRIEIVVNFNFSSIVDNNVLFGGVGALLIPLASTDGKIKYYGSAIGLSGQAGLNVLTANQNYYFRVIYDSGSLNAYISTDGINWTLDYSKNISTTFSKSGAFQLGRNTNSSSQYLRGSMNLNKSYIKINDTKYNLQAVVGYTIVGSPTIVDGVVSGFSSANYLSLNKSYTLTQNDNIEIYTRFKIDTLTGNKTILNIGSIWDSPLLSVYTDYISGLIIGNFGLATRLEVDTYYRLKIIMKDGISIGYLYNDDESVRAEKTQSLSFTDRTGSFLLGAAYGTSNPTINSLDLNNTYIKINNKLWFNGQQS